MLPPRLPHCTRTLHPHGALCPCSRWTILLCCSIRLDSCDVWWWGFVAARRSAPLPSPQVTCRMPGRAEAQGGAERQRERRVEPQEEHGSLDCHALECAACGGCAGFSAALSPRAALALATGRSNDAPTDSRAAQQQARNGEAETRHRKLESKRFLSLRTGGVRRPLCSVPFPLLLVPVDFSEREEESSNPPPQPVVSPPSSLTPSDCRNMHRGSPFHDVAAGALAVGTACERCA
jgi:hypothetical protein